MNRQNTDLQDQRDGFITPHCRLGVPIQSPPLLLPRTLQSQSDALPNMFTSPFLSLDEDNRVCTIDHPFGTRDTNEDSYHHQSSATSYYTPENRISVVQENHQNTQEVHFPYLPTLDCQHSSNQQYLVGNNQECLHSNEISNFNAYKRNRSSCLLKPKTRYRRF